MICIPIKTAKNGGGTLPLTLQKEESEFQKKKDTILHFKINISTTQYLVNILQLIHTFTQLFMFIE